VATLTNGKTYSCTVVATNAVGDGLASPASATAVPATVPTAPAAPMLTHGNASISVAIDPPNTGGSAITGYMATCTSSDGGTAGNHTSVSSPDMVSALTNGKTYTCTAHATNAVGDSTESVHRCRRFRRRRLRAVRTHADRWEPATERGIRHPGHWWLCNHGLHRILHVIRRWCRR